MKLLILSSNNGAGHNSAGRAIEEEARSRGMETEMVDALSIDAPWKSRVISEIHTRGALHAPYLFEVGNHLAERDGRREKRSGCYRANARYADKMWLYLCEHRCDTVIATHVFPALTMTHIRRHIRRDIPAYFVATDYSCAPYVQETELDGYFIPHVALRSAFIEAGVPFSRIIPSGIPVERRFSVRHEKKEARRALGLPEEGQIVLVMTGVLFLSGWLLTLLLEWDNPATLGKLPPAVRVMAAAFQSVTLRTAGFDTIGQGGLTPAGQMVAIIHMFIGASPASTGGGIKTTTFFVVFLSVAAMVRRKTDYNVYRRRLNEQLIRRALAIFTLALTLVLFDTVVISAVEGVAGAEDTLADVLYETVSAFATVGLTTGITPTLSVVSKLLISLTMFLGRVGPLTVSMALSGGPQKPDAIRYPEERLMVG